MQKGQRILVIGGGIGGLACAIAARRVGVQVDLVELKQDWKVFHVGMIVQGNCLRALAQLGIVQQVVAAGFPQSGVAFQDLHGHELFRIQGVPLAPPALPD